MKKNRKMATISLTSIIQKNFKLPNPPKVWVSNFLSVEGKQNISISHYEKNQITRVHLYCPHQWLSLGGCLLWGVVYPRGCLLPLGVCSGEQVSAPRGVCSSGVCSQGGGGVCSLGGVCSWVVSAPRGVSARGGCLLPRGCLLQGVSALGWGICCQGGVSALEGWYPSIHWGRHPHLPCGQTDTCKNITFATSLWMVMTAIL